MHKFPYMPFYTKDWLSDPALSICHPATRGVWMDLLSVMHELGRVGELTGTPEQLASWGRCSPAQLAHTLTDLKTSKAADVTERNGMVTVVNRRMKREYKEREASRLRVGRHRRNGAVTPYVTPLKQPSAESESESESESKTPLTAEPLNVVQGSGARGHGNVSRVSGSRRFAPRFWEEGWEPQTEAEYMGLMNEIAEDMANWGGKWRNRWREDKDRCLRVLRTMREDSKHKVIRATGGYMDDLWTKRMA
jgi:hypothetical protein